MKLIQAVYVFGSYARGATEPNDVDVAIDFRRDDDRWRSHFIHCMSYGKSPYVVFRKALRGNARNVSLLFEPHEGHDDVPMTLLWRRGEPVDVALERLHAIPVDLSAGRAPRDAMLACFDGLDKWLPRYLREELATLVKDEVVTIEQIALDDTDVADPLINGLIDRRWTAASPLHRAARAAMAYLEQRGIDLYSVYLHGQDIEEKITPYLVGFQLRYFRSMLRLFEKYGGREWLEFVHPTRHGPLRVLQVSLRNREKLAHKRKNPSSFFS